MHENVPKPIKKSGRVRVSQRIPGEGHGVLVLGEERFQVPMLDIGLCGMCILSPKPLEHDMQVVIEVIDVYCVDAYVCRVAFCQESEFGWQIGLAIVEHDANLLVIQIP
ncbi:MAG: PilZ domain-containing protein [Magnetococcus sp. YQC-5]